MSSFYHRKYALFLMLAVATTLITGCGDKKRITKSNVGNVMKLTYSNDTGAGKSAIHILEMVESTSRYPEVSTQERITDNEHFDWLPTWSPDGKSVIFTRGRYAVGNGDEALYQYFFDGDSTVPIKNPSPVLERQPSVSAYDGNIYYFKWQDTCQSGGCPARYGGIYRTNFGGINEKVFDEDSANEHSPSCHPTKGLLVFNSYDYSSPDANYDLFILDLDKDIVTNVTKSVNTAELDASWSPDGNWLVFVRSEEHTADPPYVNTFEIWKIRAVPPYDGLKRLTNNTWEDFDPTWSPDGKYIVYTSVVDGQAALYMIDADGELAPKRVTNIDGDQYGASFYFK